MAVGVIIARLQPIHKGHLELVRQALVENDKVLILVGSADKLNKRNPIPIAMRLDLAKKAIAEEFGEEANKVDIVSVVRRVCYRSGSCRCSDLQYAPRHILRRVPALHNLTHFRLHSLLYRRRQRPAREGTTL